MTWTNRKLFWALNLSAVALAFIAMTSRLGALISVLAGLIAVVFILIAFHVRHRQSHQAVGGLFDLYMTVASTALFWVPIYVFAGFPALQFNRPIFTILAALIIAGMIGLVASRLRPGADF